MKKIIGTSGSLLAIAIVLILVLINMKNEEVQSASAGISVTGRDVREVGVNEDGFLVKTDDYYDYYYLNDYLVLVLQSGEKKAYNIDEDKWVDFSARYIERVYKKETSADEWTKVFENGTYNLKLEVKKSDGDVTAAEFSFADNGDFIGCSIDPSAFNEKGSNYISDEEAIEKAVKYVEKEYDTLIDKDNYKITVSVNHRGGKEYKYIRFSGKNSKWASGYVCEVDPVTGEKGNIDKVK